MRVFRVPVNLYGEIQGTTYSSIIRIYRFGGQLPYADRTNSAVSWGEGLELTTWFGSIVKGLKGPRV